MGPGDLPPPNAFIHRLFFSSLETPRSPSAEWVPSVLLLVIETAGTTLQSDGYQELYSFNGNPIQRCCREKYSGPHHCNGSSDTAMIAVETSREASCRQTVGSRLITTF